jgi:hypothetical protein
MLAGEDTSTTIDSVDGDIAIMRIQLLTGVSRLLLSPNSERPPAALRTIASSSRRLPSRDRVGDSARRARPPRRRTVPFSRRP